MKYLSYAIVVTLLIGLYCVPAAFSELVLFEKGVQEPAPIVIFDSAPARTRQSAEELVQYIEKITGERPELLVGEPSPVPPRAVWVGYQPILEDLMPGTDLHFEHPEEILIAANEAHMVIAGRDRWDENHMEAIGRRHTVQDVQQEYGTANAVYTFLQDYLDVRWLWPGETGLDVVEKDRIAFDPFKYRYHPQIRQRDTMLRFSALEWSSSPYSSQWARFQRLQLDSMNAPIQGHGFGDWWERFHEEHPDYFALQPDGTRSGFPGPGTVKMCQSNPDVWEQWVDDVEKRLEDNPTQTIFSGAPNDSWHRGHCVCDDCSAWDHPDGEMRGFSWQGVSKQHVALSDRHVTFANKLARRLSERLPERDLKVVTYAYGHSRPAPIEAVPDDNVIICSVANFIILRTDVADRGSPAGVTHRQQFAGWGEVTSNLMWRPNTGGAAGWRAGNPVTPLQQTMDDFRLVADSGCIGISIDTVWMYWATQGPLYYLMAQLAWNPYQNGQEIMDDYFRRAYGPAAPTMREFWQMVEDNPGLTSDELLNAARQRLDQAGQDVAGAHPKYSERVEFTRKGIDYVTLVRENRELVERYHQSDGEDTGAAEKARDNWEKILQMNDQHPELFRRASVADRRDRPSGRLGRVHPDY